MAKYVPHRRVTVRKSLPWLSHTLLHLFKQHDRLHQRAKSLKFSAAWLSYRIAWNKAVSAVRTATGNFFSNHSSLVRTPKDFWSAYHSLLPNHQRIPAILSDGSVTAESISAKCDLLNRQFTKVFSNPN